MNKDSKNQKMNIDTKKENTIKSLKIMSEIMKDFITLKSVINSQKK